jgi:nucleotide-binding universal stress UspA family protein
MSAIVGGVATTTPPCVLESSVRFARAFDAELIGAYVDQSRFVTRAADGTQVTTPLDPDLADDGQSIPAEVTALVTSAWEGQVVWSIRLLAGDTAGALSALADEVDAAMLVVGTRRPTMQGTLAEFFNGSVAVRLAHRQRRPVVVVPVAPVGDGPLPWETADPR